MKAAPGLRGRAWTAEDDDRRTSLIEASVSIDLIAAEMKRTTQSVKYRAHVEVLIEEVRAMRDTQYEMMQELKGVKTALSAVIATSLDNISYDVRRTISDAAERIVDAFQEKRYG
jgi:gas vesicle protein